MRPKNGCHADARSAGEMVSAACGEEIRIAKVPARIVEQDERLPQAGPRLASEGVSNDMVMASFNRADGDKDGKGGAGGVQMELRGNGQGVAGQGADGAEAERHACGQEAQAERGGK